MTEIVPCSAVFVGRLCRETIINLNDQIIIDHPGGNLLYSAYGYRLWQKNAGLVSKINHDFPQDWVNHINQHGLDTRGISRVTNDIEDRRFFRILPEFIDIDNPQKYFSLLGLPFPKNLLGYTSEPVRLDSRVTSTDLTIKPGEIPEEYLVARFLAVGPLDFMTHSLIPAHFRTQSEVKVFFHPSRSYLNSAFFSDFAPLVRGATCLFASQSEMLDLFSGKSDDIWEIAEWVSGFGVEFIAISQQSKGYLLFDGQYNKRYHIPFYPSQTVDPIGVDDAFFGGIVAGYSLHFDPLQAAMIGSVTASVKIEGSPAEYLIDTLPDLAQARLMMIRDQIQIC